MRKTLYILFFSLLLLSASADFNAYGETTLTLTTCESTHQELLIQNTDQTAQTFSISVDGRGSPFVRFNTIAFEVEAGQTAQIDAFYTAPCDQPGTYPLDIYFTTATTEKILSQTISIQRPQTIKLSTPTPSQIIPLCGEATYNLTLENPTNITEHYELALQGHKDAHLTDQFITLGPGETQHVHVAATPQDCTQEGTFPLTVTVHGQQSQQTQELALTLQLQNTGVPELLAPTTTIRTDYEQSTVQIPLKNTGQETTTYTLTTNLDWVRTEPSTATLRPGETTQLTLVLTPPNIPEDTYPFTITMQLENGIVYEAAFRVKLGPPTFLERNPGAGIALGIIIIALIISIILFVIRWNSPKERAKRLKRKEKRLKKLEQRKKRKEKAKEKKLKARERKLAKKEKKRATKERKKRAKAPKEKRTHFWTTLLARRAEKPISTKERKQIEDEVEDKLQDQYHFIKKDQKKPIKRKNAPWILGIIALLILAPLFVFAWDATLIGLGALYIVIIALRIQRSYQRTKTYDALTDPTTIRVWKTGLINATITPHKPIAKFEILIKKTTPHVKQGKHYQTFTIQTNTETKTRYESSLKISKKWLKRHNIPQDNLRVSKLTNHAWKKIPATHSGEDKHYLYYTTDLKPGTYTIHGKQEQKQTHTPILAILVGTALIITLLFATFTPKELTSIGIPPQTWQANTQHHIPLANYFSDPDNDELTFTATATEHITIDIIDGQAILTPEPGWAGTENVIFIAHDEKGGSANSNTVPLTVREGLISSATQPYVVAGIGIIALIILILGFRDLKRRHKRV